MKLSTATLTLTLVISVQVFSSLAGAINGSSVGTELVDSLSRDSKLDLAIAADPSMLSRFASDSHLRGAPVSYLQNLKAGPGMNFLLAEPSGVRERYTIGQHTARVIDIYETQKIPYAIDNFPKVLGVQNWDHLMLFTLAFHDIGKSIAFRGGDKSRETVYSVPLAKDLLRAEGFSATEVQIGTALIDAHQIIGDAIRGDLSIEQAASQIRMQAKTANLGSRLFYGLLEIVFVADAGSYPALQHTIFKVENGQLIPFSDNYQSLRRLFL